MKDGTRRTWIFWALGGLALLAYPLVVPDFWVVSVGAQAIVLGLITLSLTFLAAYGGMVSLAQMAVAGVAGYTVAVLGSHSASAGAYVLPWPASVLVGMLAGIVAGLVIGAIAVRSRGIYLLMSTLAIAMIFYYLAQQNTTVLHGFDGIRGVMAPTILDRKSTRLNSSHVRISYAVFCLKKKKNKKKSSDSRLDNQCDALLQPASSCRSRKATY